MKISQNQKPQESTSKDTKNQEVYGKEKPNFSGAN